MPRNIFATTYALTHAHTLTRKSDIDDHKVYSAHSRGASQNRCVSREPTRVHCYLDNRMIYLQRAATISEQDIIPIHRDGLYLRHAGT